MSNNILCFKLISDNTIIAYTSYVELDSNSSDSKEIVAYNLRKIRLVNMFQAPNGQVHLALFPYFIGSAVDHDEDTIQFKPSQIIHKPYPPVANLSDLYVQQTSGLLLAGLHPMQ